MSSSSSSSTRSSSTSPIPISSPDTPEASFATTRPTTKADDFHRWRPSYHVQAPSGWMNDPCAPGYDPGTGLYHVSFQWNPTGPDWGDIAWGTAYSKDMIHWTIRERPTLRPDMPYDREGVFTGCHIPTSNGDLVCAYTSVSSLPIHHTLPHSRGSESLSIARSKDGGRSWTKSEKNPIIACEPPNMDVTGWRDPFVGYWDNVAEFLGHDSMTLYGIISGGIRDVTPTTFLYVINPITPEDWTYIGPLVNVGFESCPSRWGAQLGINWEVTNFVNLVADDGKQMDILMTGAESKDTRPPQGVPTRASRGQVWMSGTLQATSNPTSFSGPVEFVPSISGYLDHGLLYAAQTFRDASGGLIMWGWIAEDDLCDELRHKQGWSGMLSMPREISIQTLRRVVRASMSHLSVISSLECAPDSTGTHTARTLASRPYRPLVDVLRRKQGVVVTRIDNVELGSRLKMVTTASASWELEAIVKLGKATTCIGISFADPTDNSQRNDLTFCALTETLTLSRTAIPVDGPAQLVNSDPEVAPHTLFTTLNAQSGEEEQEPLRVRMWCDNSVLEIFVNDRTVISTRIYCHRERSALSFFIEGGMSTIVRATLWDGIGLKSTSSTLFTFHREARM